MSAAPTPDRLAPLQDALARDQWGLADSVRATLAAAQALHAQMAEVKAALSALLAEALGVLVKPGDVLRNYGDFGRLSVMRGNGRHAQAFEVVTPPRIVELNLTHPCLSRFQVEAYPLNDAGKRLSGRAGNARGRTVDTVTLYASVSDAHAFDDKRTSEELLLALIARAEAARSAA